MNSRKDEMFFFLQLAIYIFFGFDSNNYSANNIVLDNNSDIMLLVAFIYELRNVAYRV